MLNAHYNLSIFCKLKFSRFKYGKFNLLFIYNFTFIFIIKALKLRMLTRFQLTQ